MTEVTPFATMGEVLESKSLGKEPKREKKGVLDVSVFVRDGDEEDERRQREKSLMAERKRLKMILEDWDDRLVATKARKELEGRLAQMNASLKSLREDMGY